jgi:conjugal transfer pilus assembly protein TraB
MLSDFLLKRFKPTTVAKIKTYSAASVGIIAIVALVMATDGKKERERITPPNKVNIVTSQNSRELGLDAVRGITKSTQDKTEELSRAFEKLQKENEELRSNIQTSTALALQLNKTTEELNELKASQTKRDESVSQKIDEAVSKAISEANVTNILTPNESLVRQLNNDSNPNDDKNNATDKKTNLPIPKRRESNSAFSYGSETLPDDGPTVATNQSSGNTKFDMRGTSLFTTIEPEEKAERKDEEKQIYLPKTSILSGVLLTGLDAPTHSGAQESPYPVLVRIKKEAVLANFKTVKEVRECFALMSGYGDLSTERAMLRGEGITCVKYDGTVIERTMSGYAVGEDAKAGLKGTLVTRNSTVLVNAMIAGFASGVSSAFNVTPTPTYTTTTDGTVQYAEVFNASAAQGGLATGASTAMEQLASYYMNLVNQMHPVIEIGAGRVVDIVLTEGTEIGVGS